MTKMAYGEQLKHPFWQRKRLQILNRDGWACAQCSATEKTLHVHHKRYVKGLLAWQHDDADLVTYCEDCHESDHAMRDLIAEMLSRSTMLETPRWIAALVGGYLDASYAIDPDLGERCQDLDPDAFDAGVLASVALTAQPEQMVEFVLQTYAASGAGIDPSMAVHLARWGFSEPSEG